MFKRILAIALTLIMVLGVLVGCGKKDSGAGISASMSDKPVETSTGEEEESSVGTTAGTEKGDGTTVDNTEDSEEEESTTETEDEDNDESVPDLVVNDTSIYDDMTIEDLLNPDNFQGSDIPEDVDYGGYTFNLLADTSNSLREKEFVAESDGDLVKDAVVNRQEFIEEYVGIDFNVEDFAGGYYNMEGYASQIEIASGSGEPYDLALAYNLIPPIVAAKGLSKDLAESTNLNLLSTEKEYWGQHFLEEIKIGNRIFWMSDNSSWSNIRSMLCIYVNIEYFERYNEGKTKADLYKMVDDKTWTMDNMLALIQKSYEDSNLDETKDVTDSFGLCSAAGMARVDTWFYAAGFRYTEQNSEGTYDWTLANSEEKDFIGWWQGKLTGNDIMIDIESDTFPMVTEGRAMFGLCPVMATEKSIEHEYTVLPMPFYNAGIKNGYSTPFSNTYSSYFVPKATTTEAFERSATVLELIAAEGNRRIAPTYFEIFLKRQNAADDPDMQRMFNIIRNSIVFDLGYLYGSSLTVDDIGGSGGQSEVFLALRRLWAGNNTNYSNIDTIWAAIGSTATTKLSNLMIDIMDY